MNRIVDVLLLRTLADRDRRAVLLGLAVLLPALLYTAAWKPYRAALEDTREQVATERALLVREQELVAHGSALPASIRTLEDRAGRASRRLVTAANVPLAEAEVTGFLEELAQLSRVLLQEMRGVEPRRGEAAVEGLRPIRLAVRGESDLEGVLAFLHRVESSPLLMRVLELSIEPQYEGSTRAGDRRASGVVAVAMIIEAYAPPDIDRIATTGESP